jgi:protein-S-isoprenylcysteine O-methyltransferase Ste14
MKSCEAISALGAVISAFYIVAYLSLSVPAVLAGVAVSHLGLQSTFEVFGSVVAAIALIVAFGAFRTRPGSGPEVRRPSSPFATRRVPTTPRARR